MNSFVPSAWSLAIMLLFGSALSAQEPPAPPTRGKVLLLENDRLLEGEIDKVGGQYRIRRTIGELWVPCDRAKRLCRDLDEAYKIMQRQVNLRDPDERIRLARWCQQNGLKDQALHEAKIALEMRPDHTETLQMVQILQRLNHSTGSSAAGFIAPAPSPVMTASAKPAIEVDQDSFAQFSTRVQPVLINACLTCHTAGRGGAFQLVRPGDGSARIVAQKNLAMVMEFINPDKTALSPLLVKASVPHGGASAAPIRSRQSAPFGTLQTWVERAVASNPHLQTRPQEERFLNSRIPTPSERIPPPATLLVPARKEAVMKLPAETPKEFRAGEVVSRPVPRIDAKGPAALIGNASTATSKDRPAVSSNPVVTPVSIDPYDPAEFNRAPPTK